MFIGYPITSSHCRELVAEYLEVMVEESDESSTDDKKGCGHVLTLKANDYIKL